MQKIILTGLTFLILSTFVVLLFPSANAQTMSPTSTPTPTPTGIPSTPKAPATGHAR